MKLLRTFPILAYAVMLLSIVGVSIAGRSAAMLLVGGVLAAMSWYVTEGPRGRSLPNWTANVLIIAVTLNVVVDVVQHFSDVLSVLARFIVMLVLIKLYQHKTPRDWAQLLGLSLLLMLIGCLQSNDLLFAVTLLAYALLGLYVLLLFQLWAANERHRRRRLAAIPAGYRLLPSLSPITGRRTAGHLRGLMAGIAVSGIGLSLVLFLLFPRGLGEGFMGLSAAGRHTGFAAEVNLTDGTRITQSRRVVLNVRITGGAAPEPLRLRGAALDLYDGRGRWHADSARRASAFTTQPPDLTELTWLAPGSRLVEQQVDLLMPGNTLFCLASPVAVGTDRPRSLRYDPPTATLHDAEPGALDRYTVRSVLDPSDALLERLAEARPVDTSEMTRQFTPYGEVRMMARQVLSDAAVPPAPPVDPIARWDWNARAAEVLCRHFHHGEYAYTLDLGGLRLAGDGSMRDPILQFLFQTRRGHCEYFASALAALCDSIGVPARVIAGYVTLERDEPTGMYIVRESNAHAWVEVLTGPHRWQTYDPTPPGTLRQLHGGEPSAGDRWRWVLDRFEARWSSSFVAFDGRSQQRLLQSLDVGWSDRLRAGLSAIRDWAARINHAFYMGPAGYIWLGIVGTALVIAAIAAWTRLRRAARLREALRLRGDHPPLHRRFVRQLGFYLDMLRVLEQAGHPKPAWQPPMLFARRLARRQPEAGAIVRRLAETLYQVRYGGRRLRREEAAEARGLVDSLGRVLRKP